MSRVLINNGITKYEGFVRFKKKPEIFRLNATNSYTAKPLSIVAYRDKYRKHGHSYGVVALDFTAGQEPLVNFFLLSSSRLTRNIQSSGQNPETCKPVSWTCRIQI